jgi:hypothetical protein
MTDPTDTDLINALDRFVKDEGALVIHDGTAFDRRLVSGSVPGLSYGERRGTATTIRKALGILYHSQLGALKRRAKR